MGEVIEYADFYTLRMIRQAIKEMERRNTDGQFDIGIKGDRALFKDVLGRLQKAGWNGYLGSDYCVHCVWFRVSVASLRTHNSSEPTIEGNTEWID